MNKITKTFGLMFLAMNVNAQQFYSPFNQAYTYNMNYNTNFANSIMGAYAGMAGLSLINGLTGAMFYQPQSLQYPIQYPVQYQYPIQYQTPNIQYQSPSIQQPTQQQIVVPPAETKTTIIEKQVIENQTVFQSPSKTCKWGTTYELGPDKPRYHEICE